MNTSDLRSVCTAHNARRAAARAAAPCASTTRPPSPPLESETASQRGAPAVPRLPTMALDASATPGLPATKASSRERERSCLYDVRRPSRDLLSTTSRTALAAGQRGECFMRGDEMWWSGARNVALVGGARPSRRIGTFGPPDDAASTGLRRDLGHVTFTHGRHFLRPRRRRIRRFFFFLHFRHSIDIFDETGAGACLTPWDVPSDAHGPRPLFAIG